MIKCFRDSIRVSQNIARQLGVECPIKVLYVDNLFDNLARVRNSLCLLREKVYNVDTTLSTSEAIRLAKINLYDALLVNESVHIDEDECPLIIVPKYMLEFSKWKLAYSLDELIHDLIGVPAHIHKIEQQQIVVV